MTVASLLAEAAWHGLLAPPPLLDGLLMVRQREREREILICLWAKTNRIPFWLQALFGYDLDFDP